MSTKPGIEAVVIGGSAGGVTAMQRLLARLPRAYPLPIALVLHIPSHRESGLADLFSRAGPVPAVEALDKQPFAAGSLYLAPPDYHLLIEPGATLALSCDHPVLHSRPAIDPLFESAAEVYGDALLAIVLTGASQDGAAGAAVVRRHGGTVWVQEPDTAEARIMPAAAIERAGADRIMDLETMAIALAEIGR